MIEPFFMGRIPLSASARIGRWRTFVSSQESSHRAGLMKRRFLSRQLRFYEHIVEQVHSKKVAHRDSVQWWF